MRTQFCDAMVARSNRDELVFLTGDLGFMALEPLQEALGQRFINAGVAEQNMVTAAAAMASRGLEVWTYSIAPFVYARPFEQIRNDVCFHGLPVRLVGNGGGYGYGPMGPTHHAIDDYGALLTLPGMAAIVPAFDEDIADAVALTDVLASPVYLRLGRGEPPAGWQPPKFEPWRKITDGGGPVVVGIGPVAGTFISLIEEIPERSRPNLWIAGLLPVERFAPPDQLLREIGRNGSLCVVEEHVSQGSMASQLLLHLALGGTHVKRFAHLYAKEHNYGTYGSQTYLRRLSSLDVDSMIAALDGL